MNSSELEKLRELVGDDLTFNEAKFVEVLNLSGDMVAHYDDELEVLSGYARVFFKELDGHSENFLLELGRRAIDPGI